GIYYQFRTLDSTIPVSTTIGQWQENLSGGMTAFNKAKNPPMSIHFCWDSVIDKKEYPNIRLTDKQILIETVSGEKMEMCKGISRHDFSLGDDEYVLEFIKDKKYPYGNW
ncbi:DUF2931 family protein, partial [Escherichia coli]|uniref:DUF2931 family protein n=1 Tax=Escherichia coli TaxID=562 RepID=UPI001F4A7A77